ncbi:MAG: hypothetical protein IH949_08810 [Bacteroidetes bacterium]|nr:hypothetical protein [Bacteroidota bacterium]
MIMPNHLHGILILNDNQKNALVETGYIQSLLEGEIPLQQKINILSKQNNIGYPTLADIIGKFKAAVTRKVSKLGYKDFQWQSSFYDRIIRNEKELFLIRKYIKVNPLKWEIEKYSQENLDFN